MTISTCRRIRKNNMKQYRMMTKWMTKNRKEHHRIMKKAYMSHGLCVVLVSHWGMGFARELGKELGVC